MAEGVNKVILLGNLGKDPELRVTQGGAAKCSFSLATTESYVDRQGARQERTDWHNIVVWGKQAESVGKFLKKGRQCYIEGRVQTRSYDDKDGNKRFITEINANRVVFVGGAPGGRDGGGGAPDYDNYEPGPPAAGADFVAQDDDIPF